MAGNFLASLLILLSSTPPSFAGINLIEQAVLKLIQNLETELNKGNLEAVTSFYQMQDKGEFADIISAYKSYIALTHIPHIKYKNHLTKSP